MTAVRSSSHVRPGARRLTFGARPSGGGFSTLAIVALVLVLMLAGAGVWYYASSGKSGAAAADLTADRAVVRASSFDISTTANGELEAKNQREIRSELEIESKITKIVAEGTSVKKGDVLVELNSDKIDKQITDEQIAVDSATAEKTTAENNYQIQITDNATKIRQAELKLDLAILAMKQWEEGDVKQKRQQNALSLEKAQRELKRLKEKFDRSEELFKSEFLSKNEYDLDYIAKIEAEANLAKAELEGVIYETYTHPKEQKKNQSDVDDARAELERTKLNTVSELANKKAALDRATKQLSQRQENLERYQKQKAACTITAPQDGLVVYGTSLERGRWMFGGNGPLNVGSDVYPNMLLIVLPDTREMVASVKVQETLSSRIQPGQTATIRIDAAGGKTVTGRVESIGVLAESTNWRDPNLREYTVKITLEGLDESSGLKPSMRCEAQIIFGRVESAVSVPVQAVFNDGAVLFAYVPQGQKFARVPVRLGRKSETSAEIMSGLTEGQVVLLREPTAGEVIASPWEKSQLALAGYDMGEDGVPFVAGGGGKGGPGGRGGRGGKPPGMAGKPDAAVVVPAEAAKPEPKVEPAGDVKPAGDETKTEPAPTAGQPTPVASGAAPAK